MHTVCMYVCMYRYSTVCTVYCIQYVHLLSGVRDQYEAILHMQYSTYIHTVHTVLVLVLDPASYLYCTSTALLVVLTWTMHGFTALDDVILKNMN